MSVDFYVAVPSSQWPSAAALDRCAAEQGHPIKVLRFPNFNATSVVTDGSLVRVEERTVYLEGELSPASMSAVIVETINNELAVSRDDFRVKENNALLSIRVRSVAEFQAAKYVISALIICFSGYGFEPQGGTHGRDGFAKSLVNRADALHGLDR